MAISKGYLNVYISLSKNHGKAVVNAYAVLETRRRELLSRMSQIYTASCKGIKLSLLEIDQIQEQNEKMARDLLGALFGANASDYHGMDFTISSNAKTTTLLQMLLVSMIPLFKNQQVTLFADPENIRLNQLQNALKKAGITAAVQSESFASSPGGQISRFLGDLYISDHLPKAKSALQRELAYEKRFCLTSGDAAFLQSIAPANLKSAFAALSELPAASLEAWAKKGISLSALENARKLLDAGVPAQVIAEYSASKLGRPYSELLEKWQARKAMREESQTDNQQKVQETAADTHPHVKSQTGQPENKPAAMDQAAKPSADKTQLALSAAKPASKKGPSILPSSTIPDAIWNGYAENLVQSLLPSSVKESGDAALQAKWSKSLQEAFPQLQSGQALRASMLERLLAEPKMPVLDIWVREKDNTLQILVTYTRKKLLEKLQHDQDHDKHSDELQSLYKIYNFEGDAFSLRLQTLFAWLSTLQNRYFLHIPGYMETEVKKMLIEQNWMIPMSFTTLEFPKEPGTLQLKSSQEPKVRYLDDSTRGQLDADAIRVLSLPEMSLSLTKLLARAFARGLDHEQAETIWYNTQGQMRQERMRSLAGQYVFTTAARKEMESLLEQHVDLALWDFLSHPALSASRRTLILDAWKNGWSMEQIRSCISVRNSTKVMQEALEKGPQPVKASPNPASFVVMPAEIRQDLESSRIWMAAKGKKNKKKNIRRQMLESTPEMEALRFQIDLLEEYPL